MLNKMKKILEKSYKYILLLLCIIIVFAIIENLFNEQTIELDLIIHKLIVEDMRNEYLTSIFKIITNLGGAYFIIFVTLLSLILIKDKKISFSIALNSILITGLNLLLKNIIARPRPEGFRLIDETGYSFPSGHSMVSAAFYGLIIYFVWKNVKNIVIRNSICCILSLLIFFIGLSRIYLGVHYATDVAGGFVISIAYLVIFTIVYKNIFENKKNV